jgi:hypothetical protein
MNAVLVAAYSTNIFTDQGFNQTNFLMGFPFLIAGGFYYEGIRLLQFPTILSYLIYAFSTCLFVSQFNVALNIFCIILPVLSFFLTIFFGDLSLRKLKLSGKYQTIGFREFRMKSGEGHTNEVSVFYPSATPLTDANNAMWLRHGEKTLLGIARASGGNAYGNKDNKHTPLWIMRSFLSIRMETAEEGELPDEFAKGHKKLIPIIYCHGLSSNRSMHSGTCRDLASHGYIVFIMDHEDGTSSYTVSEDGKKEQNYDNSMICYDHDGRRA